MKRYGLTLSIVMRAESANYGEGFGNLSVLKKVSRSDHKQYSYISRQALRYNIVRQLDWDKTPVNMEQNVVQFALSATIRDYPEIDLFGYMKTVKKSEEGDAGGAITRSAVARLSHAIALEPFNGDLDYLTNMGLARRANLQNVIAQAEIQASYYAYTLTIDLDRVGVDGEINLPAEEKASRVEKLLDALQFLYRDIKGRRENLAPLFVVGGVYERKNPYFEHRISVKNNAICVDMIKETIEGGQDDTKTNTRCGVLSGVFANDADIKKELGAVSVAEFFNELKSQAREQYNG